MVCITICYSNHFSFNCFLLKYVFNSDNWLFLSTEYDWSQRLRNETNKKLLKYFYSCVEPGISRSLWIGAQILSQIKSFFAIQVLKTRLQLRINEYFKYSGPHIRWARFFFNNPLWFRVSLAPSCANQTPLIGFGFQTLPEIYWIKNDFSWLQYRYGERVSRIHWWNTNIFSFIY